MFDWLVAQFTDQPYPMVAFVFLLCGLGLPLPEEIVLAAAGYVCFKGIARVEYMIPTCVAAILVGDLVPFWLGRKFGARLLRIRWLRLIITRQRLATFDTWFRRRGDLVIFIARFIAGLRVVAFFTAGTMKMSFSRFIMFDGLGILLVSPALVWLGYAFGSVVDEIIAKVQKAERAILITAAVASLLTAGWLWWRNVRKRRKLMEGPKDSYVEPPEDAGSLGEPAQPGDDAKPGAPPPFS